MRQPYFLIVLCLLLGFYSCSSERIEVTSLLASPSSNQSSLPHLTTAPNGEIYLSWVEQNGDNTTLKYSKRQDSKWSTAEVIALGNNWFVNWADFPSLMVNGDHMAAHWLQKSNLGTYDYDVRLALTSNGGQDWGESFIIHNDGIAAEHGFASMLPMDNNQTFITWLDGRNTKKEGGAMTLRGAIFDSSGEALNRWELDNRICDCCQTGTAMTSNGPIVIYRDRTENEVRDMSIVRWENGQWTQPTPIAVELWEIAGCPVNGPQITAQDNHVAAAWFTAANGTPKVKIALSQDSGASFDNPIILSEGNTLGRVGITTLTNGQIVVSWLDNIDSKASIMAAKFDQNGNLLKKIQVAETSIERSSGFPVITSSGNEVIMAWTEAGETTKVLTAKVNL